MRVKAQYQTAKIISKKKKSTDKSLIFIRFLTF